MPFPERRGPQDLPPQGGREPPGEGQLLERIRAGDEEAFAVLVERYGERLFRLVLGVVGDWHLSEDVVQEVFVLVHRNIDRFDGRSTLLTWLYRIAVNAALKARRRARRRAPVALEEGEERRSAEAPVGFDLEMREVAQKLLRCLPAKLRIVVLLKEWEGLGYEEIGRVLRCSRGAVEQRLHRAMVELRRVWKPLVKEEWFDGL